MAIKSIHTYLLRMPITRGFVLVETVVFKALVVLLFVFVVDEELE